MVFAPGLLQKWLFLMRTTKNVADQFQPLEEAIRSSFIPALVGREVSDQERKLLSLPTRFGGLGIANPVEIAEMEHNASLNSTKAIKNLIKEQALDFSSVNWEDILYTCYNIRLYF